MIISVFSHTISHYKVRKSCKASTFCKAVHSLFARFSLDVLESLWHLGRAKTNSTERFMENVSFLNWRDECIDGWKYFFHFISSRKEIPLVNAPVAFQKTQWAKFVITWHDINLNLQAYGLTPIMPENLQRKHSLALQAFAKHYHKHLLVASRRAYFVVWCWKH